MVFLGSFWTFGPACCQAQFFPATRFEPSDEVTLDLAESSTRTHLERVKALLAAEQWDDAVEILRQVMENHGGKMFEVSPQRYVSLRDYCQMWIASLPPPALKLYRDRIDAQARRLYEEGLHNLDRTALQQVATQYFASSVGDDALFALGELALARADYSAARHAWSQLVEWPQEPIASAVFQKVRHAPGLAAEEAQLLDRWYQPVDTVDSPYHLKRLQAIDDPTIHSLVRLWNKHGVLSKRMAYPATDLDLAAIRARLVLVSILEGSPDQARDELAALAHLHPQAEGKLGGRTGKYLDLLGALLEASAQWAALPTRQTWHTFAGSPQRNFVANERLDLGELVWKRPLEKNTASDFRVASSFGFSPRRVAEDSTELLSYHPIVVDNHVFVSAQDKILAFDVASGEPAWGASEGAIFKGPEGNVRGHARHSQLGAPRYTLTALDNLLFARLGSAATTSVIESPYPTAAASIKWFDLQSQASLVRSIEPGESNRSFDGVPLCDGRQVYVALRVSEAGPQTQAHVACYDVQTGKLRWQRYVCAAVTAGRSQMDEITHNLLTLDRGTLYFNTNLGAVAALNADDGQVQWIARYPRSMGGELNRTAKHVYRDLTPCVLDKGRLYVAPADSERLFAFSTATGDLLWASAAGCPEDAVHVLGVLHGTVVASGDRLWGFDAATGRVRAVWPDNASPTGFGRGVLMGDEVVWPTRQELYRFRLEQRVARDPETAAERPMYWWQNTHIDKLFNQEASGGNLVVAKDHLLIATSDMLYAFKRYHMKEPVVSSQ